MNTPRLSEGLAKRIYPTGKPVDLVEALMRAAVIARITGRESLAEERMGLATGFLDLRTSQPPNVIEYLQWGGVPGRLALEGIVPHIDDVLGEQGFQRLGDKVLDPALLYQGSSMVARVDVTYADRVGQLFVTMEDMTLFYQMCKSAVPLVLP